MKLIGASLVAILFLSACGSDKKEKLPIPESELPSLLADIHLAEAVIQNTNGNIRDSVADVYYQQIFLIHNLSEEDFDKTMAILREDPARIKPIYDKVLEIISEREAQMEE